jgi:peptide/nickel transport system substrate-binding protein
VEIKLNYAYENLPLLLDVPIVPKDQVNAEQPLGSGPYIVDSSLTGMRLKRLNSWWCNGKLVINASSITLVEAESPAQIRDQFEFFDVGLVCADPGSDTYADFRCDFELWDCENGMFLYLGCNMESPVFSNEAMRSALTYAIDRDYLVDHFYRGFARSATLAASPLSPFYNSGLAARYEYNAQRFAQAVKDSDMTGKTVTLLVNKDDSLRLRAARSVVTMLQAGGLEVQLSQLKTSDYKAALKKGAYDLYLGQTKLSPNMDLSTFFASNGALNAGNIDDPAYYAIALEALANRGNYYTLHKMLADDGRICPILFRSYAIYAARGLVSGLTPSRENIFYYDRGRTLEDALIREQ